MSEPDDEDSSGNWCHGQCRCRMCGHEYVGVWPEDVVVGEENMECPSCGNMTSGPIQEDEE